jgi:iron complex outermembrane recepter protein
MRGQNMQVYLSEQLQQNNPLNYVFLHAERKQWRELRVRGEASYRLNSRWQISGSGSLLRTRYLDVSGFSAGLDIDGRAQPFAPGYKLAAAVEYHDPNGWFARVDASAIGSFYYYTSDAQTSRAYNLENVRGWLRGGLDDKPWVRNLFDARYAQKGFYFGLIPPNFPNQSFLQLGDPRQIGITVSYELKPSTR